MHAIARLNNKNHFTMCCDFCAVPEYEEGVRLIASPNGTHICQNCVTISAALVDERGWNLHDSLSDDPPTPKEPE